MVRGVETMTKQVWISDECYEYIRKMSYETRIPMGKLISNALTANTQEQQTKITEVIL
jgi:ribosomal protein L37AE/L43A